MDELNQVKADLRQMRSHIAELEAAQKMTLRELDLVKKSVTQAHKATAEMLGTFTSLEQHMVRLFEENAATQAWKARVEARLDALEKRQPPAA